MTTILDEIVENKRSQLEQQMRQRPLSAFQDTILKSDRDFLTALKNPSPAFILECKKASPSRGLIRPDFDLPSIARTYGQFASAISVLTETDYFQGSLHDLSIVRSSVRQPVLCKDFVVDPYQIYLARLHGADAVLLILAILDDRQFTALFQAAGKLGMAAITEVSTEDEARRARELGCPIVGINNRNLRDMSIDLDRTRTMAGALRKGALVISESGFQSHDQVREVSSLVDGFLIGSSLMAEADLDLAVRQVVFGENKVCGLTRRQDATVAAESGAVYGGLIFVESSPRRVSVQQAAEVKKQVRLRFVGVFQDQDVQLVASTAEALSLDAVQLHGHEDRKYIAALRCELTSKCRIWKATAVDHVSSFLHAEFVDRIVVDTCTGTQKGGTGETFDWTQLPPIGRSEMMLAGGLTPENALGAAALGCAGLDFNSGLEVSPGVKSADKIRAAFSRLRCYNDQV